MVQVGARLSQLPAPCQPLASAHPAPQVALPGSVPVGQGGGHHRMCLSGVKPFGCPALLRWVLLPYPQITQYIRFRKQTQWQVQTGRDGIKNGRGGICIGGNTESRGAGTDWTQGSPRQSVAQGGNQKDIALNFLASPRVPPIRPLSQGICGLPRLGRAAIATATELPESLHCSSISGCGGAAPPGPAPQPHPLMTLSLLY